jgi:hypothetical protein
MKSFLPAFEHGLLMCEIDELLLQVPKDAKGIIEYRPDEFGEWGMRTGGVMEEIVESVYASSIEEPTLKSNTHQVPMKVKSLDDLKEKDLAEDLIYRKKIK